MRVISGSARGRLIVAPPGDDIRPTTDKTRTALFNALMSRNMVQDATIIDLFAGTGSLGIEALSRGAARATFIDSDRVAVDCIRYNLETLGFAGESTVIRADVNRWIDSQITGRAAAPFVATEDSPLVVLADPPYAFTAWNELLERLHPRLAPFGVDAIVVLESGKAIDLPDTWELDREARYGAAHVTFARPVSSEAEAEAEAESESELGRALEVVEVQ